MILASDSVKPKDFNLFNADSSFASRSKRADSIASADACRSSNSALETGSN